MKYETRNSIFGIMASMFGLTGTYQQRNRWKPITFRTHTPRELTAEQRANRIGQRKKRLAKRQKLILCRGWA